MQTRAPAAIPRAASRCSAPRAAPALCWPTTAARCGVPMAEFQPGHRRAASDCDLAVDSRARRTPSISTGQVNTATRPCSRTPARPSLADARTEARRSSSSSSSGRRYLHGQRRGASRRWRASCRSSSASWAKRSSRRSAEGFPPGWGAIVRPSPAASDAGPGTAVPAPATPSACRASATHPQPMPYAWLLRATGPQTMQLCEDARHRARASGSCSAPAGPRRRCRARA